MTRRDYGLLLAGGLFVVALVAVFQPAPGYMDAEYYFAIGQRLAAGQGFTEPFLWNYLDDPAGLPHPSHAYWLPLASMLSAAGLKIFSATAFGAAQVGFVLVSALIPVVTAALAFSLTQRSSTARLAGVLAIFSFFYLPFLPTTDTFSIYMLLGGALLITPARVARQFWRAVLLGLLAALMALSRADGLLWLFIAALLGFADAREWRWRAVLVVVLTFLVVISPWVWRNYNTWGRAFAPGGATALWLTDYDQLYAYPAAQINFANWWQQGLHEIVATRLWAFGQNLQTAIAVQGGIFLAPLMLLGAWQLRKRACVRVGLLAWALTFLVMTLVFPFAGARGGFFHSGAALQPLLWALAPAGLEVFLAWGVRVRGWSPRSARRVFTSALIGFAALLSAYIFGTRLLGWGPENQPWGTAQSSYAALQQPLSESAIPPESILLVNNPPGFYLATQRPAIVIPDGDVETLLAVARRYDARYVVLEYNHPRGLNELYARPDAYSQFEVLWQADNRYLLQIREE